MTRSLMLGVVGSLLCILSRSAADGVPGSEAKRPNIVFIVADDLGWNDVSLHGSPQIPTPHIDAIAHSGVHLTNYHVQPVCTPTRSTFLSGRHVIHTGIYMPFAQGTALRLNLSYTLLPAYLKKLGYRTAAVGKWHLGQNVEKALPTGRGFDEYLGYWSGAEDYYTHDTHGGYDFQDGTECAIKYNNTYSTYIFAERAVNTILEADPEQPLFLYTAFQNVHWPLEAPAEYVARFSHIPNSERQYVAAMTSILDDAVGNITDALKRSRIADNTILIFTSDNGGPVHDENTESNNYPLRGGKNTLWNGGTQVVGMIAGKGIENPGTDCHGMMHASDWLPSLV
ncbi:uncharacterized protein MONBRDRAFT_13917 [Monosiga brevicollis MX1]|uniref:Sulfatase N-terminal domain-containing protein n=1 Tax=Monosiga brevicollis TaxID=81824 RepID=A9UP45_MONBE|nr:uncharacterized protein MONBRDRAFT_13917 [Monosiga brevicollis MX1]EDQ92357.1 predicted protein [Monosiga brevicollis MX1]|eukprot:XP_001742119.1 hypothetical protein [Monosiga brevicollis MX1]